MPNLNAGLENNPPVLVNWKATDCPGQLSYGSPFSCLLYFLKWRLFNSEGEAHRDPPCRETLGETGSSCGDVPGTM